MMSHYNIELPDDIVSLDEDDVATNRELGITSDAVGFFGKDPGGTKLKKGIIPFLGTVAMGFVRASGSWWDQLNCHKSCFPKGAAMTVVSASLHDELSHPFLMS